MTEQNKKEAIFIGIPTQMAYDIKQLFDQISWLEKTSAPFDKLGVCNFIALTALECCLEFAVEHFGYDVGATRHYRELYLKLKDKKAF